MQRTMNMRTRLAISGGRDWQWKSYVAEPSGISSRRLTTNVSSRISAHISFDNGFGDITQQDFCNYFWNGNWIECSTINSFIQYEKHKKANN